MNPDTRTAIRKLCREAAQGGEVRVVELCGQALRGDAEAERECARMIEAQKRGAQHARQVPQD